MVMEMTARRTPRPTSTAAVASQKILPLAQYGEYEAHETHKKDRDERGGYAVVTLLGLEYPAHEEDGGEGPASEDGVGGVDHPHPQG